MAALDHGGGATVARDDHADDDADGDHCGRIAATHTRRLGRPASGGVGRSSSDRRHRCGGCSRSSRTAARPAAAPVGAPARPPSVAKESGLTDGRGGRRRRSRRRRATRRLRVRRRRATTATAAEANREVYKVADGGRRQRRVRGFGVDHRSGRDVPQVTRPRVAAQHRRWKELTIDPSGCSRRLGRRFARRPSVRRGGGGGGRRRRDVATTAATVSRAAGRQIARCGGRRGGVPVAAAAAAGHARVTSTNTSGAGRRGHGAVDLRVPQGSLRGWRSPLRPPRRSRPRHGRSHPPNAH